MSRNRDWTQVLKDMARPAVRLETGAGTGIEAGRFGGKPDVPADFAWPYFETAAFFDETVKPRPLSFLAQFDCAALAPLDPEGLLPQEGVLSFFYELESQSWGYDPKDAGSARAYWFPDKAALSPADFPADMEEYCRLPSTPFRAWAETSYPCYEDYALTLSDPYSEEGIELWKVFDEARQALQGPEEPESRHRLLGWADVIQNNMTRECELVSQGYFLGRGWENIPPEARQAAAEPSLDKWRLLFQLDSVTIGDFDLMFGDCGQIYFFIRKEDLAARRFDRVWLIQQCY